jgi:hypothetical protein
LYATKKNMHKINTTPLAFILLICFCSCSIFPQFNESGRESKLKCLYFLTDSIKIFYKCSSQQKIASLTVIDDTKLRWKPIYFEKKFDPAVSEYTFPFHKDSLTNKTFRILISITESHSREGYTIYVKPENFTNKNRVYCRYSPL